MAEQQAKLKYLDDLTECPICKSDHTDPRVLSCIHTFCLKCLEDWSERKQTEQQFGCPLCRREIIVPEGGIAELPRNCFVQKLLDVKELSEALSQTELLCDVCGNDTPGKRASAGKKTKQGKSKGRDGTKDEERGSEKAIVYCIECRTNMCEQCCGCHQKFRFNSSHNLIELEGELQADELLAQFPESTCDKHRDKNLEIYCNECKVAVCMMCYIKSHKSHECSDVKEVAEELSKQMKADGEGIDGKATECKEMLEKLSADEKQFVALVDETEKAILDKCEEMKKLIENHKSKLIEELSAAKRKQVKQIALVRDEVERRLIMIGNFKKYSEELQGKGTPCDIAKAANSIRERAKELLRFDVFCDLDSERTSADVKFSSQLPIENVEKVFGELKVTVTTEENFQGCTKPIHVIPTTGNSVSGVASLDDELFVSRWNTQQIAVYDSATFSNKRNISLPNSGYVRGLAVCSTNKCLYVTDQNSHCVRKVGVSGTPAATQWSVGVNPYGISVNSIHNVIVACYGDHTIREYTTQGTSVRQINLQSNMTNPTHAVQLSNDQYGVLHHGTYHRYCITDINGQLVKSYGNSAGSGDGQLFNPYGLAVNRRGYVFIASLNINNKIVLLYPSDVEFSDSQLSIEAFEGGFNQPCCLHMDEIHGRLYIGEWQGGRVIVLERPHASTSTGAEPVAV